MKPSQTKHRLFMFSQCAQKLKSYQRGIIKMSKLLSQQHGDVLVMLPTFNTGQRHIFCGTKNLSKII